MNNVKEKAIMFGKAQCSAWVASAVDFGITLILTSLVDVWYGYSTFIGAVCGGLTNCGINYRWVFHTFGMKKKYVALRYTFVWVGSIRGCVLELSSTTHIRVPRQPQQPAGISRRLLSVSYGSPSVSYACSCVGIS